MSVLFVSNVGFLGNNLLPSAHVHLVMMVPLPRIASPQDINQSLITAAGPHFCAGNCLLFQFFYSKRIYRRIFLDINRLFLDAPHAFQVYHRLKHVPRPVTASPPPHSRRDGQCLTADGLSCPVRQQCV